MGPPSIDVEGDDVGDQAPTSGSNIGPFSGLNFFLADGSGSGGAGFTMSKEQMTVEMGRLEQLRYRIETQRLNARPMANIVSPGLDPASLRNTDACNNSGRYYIG